MSTVFHEEELSGWGRFRPSRSEVAWPERREEIVEILSRMQPAPAGVIARGTGLSYGDPAVNSGGHVVAMGRYNKILDFNPSLGHIRCEAGVTLSQIFDIGVQHGWFVHVTPGTSRLTVGGAFGCDIHGKNHPSAGSFSQHVLSATILTGTGDIVTCGPDKESDLFWATAGGIGMTGIILEMTIELQRIETARMISQKIVTRDLEDTFRKITEHDDATYSIAWMEGVRRGKVRGRGFLMTAEHAKLSDLPPNERATALSASRHPKKSLRFGIPSPLIRRPVALAFNEIVYRHYLRSAGKPQLVPLKDYFYFLDTYDNWTRLYGGGGFIEYQVLLPKEKAFDAARKMLEIFDKAGVLSFLTSMKRLGANAPGHMSFPTPGLLFSVDIPAGRKRTLDALDRCDDIVRDVGGRHYVAKDARVQGDFFRSMYPRYGEWLQIVRRYDPKGMFSSNMSRRLQLR
jgi:FAD/FMN-containing dehydrogenase